MRNPEEVLEAWRSGADRDRVFRQLCDLYWQRVVHLFARKRYSREEQEDLTQETFLHVYKGMGEFHGTTGAALSGWVYSIAANIHSSQARRDLAGKRAASEVQLEGDFPEDSTPWDSIAADPLEELLREERRQRLRRELEDLPKQARRVAELRYVQDLTMSEIAMTLNIKVDTVKAHLYQVRQRIMARLGEKPSAPAEPPNALKRQES
jgi:RNA polymerase sigma-70 factor (ECF subfamily)